MPRKTREEALKTKQLIIDAGFKLFYTRGYENTSLSDIANEANVTRGAIYWHFKDKEDLLFEIFNIIDRQKLRLDLLEKAGDLNTKDPQKFFRKWLLNYKNDEAVRFFNSALLKYFLSVVTGSEATKSVKSQFSFICERWGNLISKAFDNGIDKGDLPLDFDKNMAGRLTNIFIIGYINSLNIKCDSSVISVYPNLVDNLINTLKNIQPEK